MDEMSKLIKYYTVLTVAVIMLMTFVSASFIAGFKVEFNITGEEKPKIGYGKNISFNKEDI